MRQQSTAAVLPTSTSAQSFRRSTAVVGTRKWQGRYLIWAAVGLAMLQPLLQSTETVGYVSVGFIALALWRFLLRERIPGEILLLAGAFVIAAIPYLSTGNFDDLRMPLTDAAFIIVVGGSVAPRWSGTNHLRTIQLLALATFAQTLGTMLRHNILLQNGRQGWNLVGWLAVVTAISIMPAFPKLHALALFVAAVGLAVASGSRSAGASLAIGILIVTLGAKKKWRNTLVAMGLAALLAFVFWRGYRSNVEEEEVAQRASRAFTFDDSNRGDAWSYWLDVAVSHPFGTGFQTGNDEYWLVPGHNTVLDLAARGGLLCALMFILAQVVIGFRLHSYYRIGLVNATAVGLFWCFNFRSQFENASTYGMNLLPIIYIWAVGLEYGRSMSEARPGRIIRSAGVRVRSLQWR